MLYVLVRFGGSRHANALGRAVSQLEVRLERNQLRVTQMVEVAWALNEMHPTGMHPFSELLTQQAAPRFRSEGDAMVADVLRIISQLPFKRPIMLVQPLCAALGELCARRDATGAPVPLGGDFLSDVLDALARLRFDEPTLLTALEAHVAGALERGALHEAQAACVVESFGTLRYRPRAELLTKLLERVHSEGGGGGTGGGSQLLPHSAVALLHGCALLRIVPSPKTCGDFLTLAAQSGLPLDLPEIATVLWSLVQLAQPEPAVELLNSLPADVQEQIVTSDAQSLCLLVWSLLTLRQHEHFLLQPTLVALVGMGAGLKQLAQLCLLAESALMLQLEVPPALGLGLPPELMAKATIAWARQQQMALEGSPDFGVVRQVLLELGGALENLQVQHGVNVLNSYLIDVVIPREVSGGSNLALLVHAPIAYTSTGELVGTVQLKRRLLQSQGWVVLDVPVPQWAEKSTDEAKIAAVRAMLQPHITAAMGQGAMPPQQLSQQLPPDAMGAGGAGAGDGGANGACDGGGGGEAPVGGDWRQPAAAAQPAAAQDATNLLAQLQSLLPGQ